MNKQQLSEALGFVEQRLGMGRGFGLSAKGVNETSVLAAARLALPLLPEKCGTCGGRGWTWTDDRENYGEQNTCDDCHGGWVWDPETVERIARVIYDSRWGEHAWDNDRPAGFILDELQEVARAVLAALNSPTPEEAK